VIEVQISLMDRGDVVVATWIVQVEPGAKFTQPFVLPFQESGRYLEVRVRQREVVEVP
jgi:hypothetical protein